MDMSGMLMSSLAISNTVMASSTGPSVNPASTGSAISAMASAAGTSTTGSMGGMPMYMTSAGSMMMSVQSMMMTFFSANNTPLYSLAWTPNTTGQYAGTCIFLIVLAIICRSLVALRANLEYVSSTYARKKDTHILRTRPGHVRRPSAQQWRVNDALTWAVTDTLLAGVNYLLMLAVMTMNIGYFLSILGGTFAGSFVVGRWTGTHDIQDLHSSKCRDLDRA